MAFHMLPINANWAIRHLVMRRCPEVWLLRYTGSSQEIYNTVKDNFLVISW